MPRKSSRAASTGAESIRVESAGANTVREGAFQFYGLLVLLILAPLPAGSIAPWAQSLMTLGIFSLLAAWALYPAGQPGRVQPNGAIEWHGEWPGYWTAECTAERNIKIPAALCLFALAFICLQVLPLPGKVVATLAPGVHTLYTWTLPAIADASWHSLSTTPAATVQGGILIGACAAVFFLTTRYCRGRGRIMTVVGTVVIVGTGEALYGLTQVGGNLFRPASGTFLNRNHYGAFLAMALCLGIGLFLFLWQSAHERPADRQPPLAWWIRNSPLLIACLTILAGIFFSFSRMAVGAPLVMLLLFGGIWLFGAVSKRVRLVTVGIAAVLTLLLAGAWPAIEVVAERFHDLWDPYRAVAWEGTYALFRSSPIVGIGVGGLIDNLPRFLTEPIKETFTHSHNEPLELLAEGGVVYFMLVGSAMFVYFAMTIPAWRKRHDPFARGVGLGCMAGALAVLLHSMVEFPLRIPANALYFSVIMALGWVTIPKRSRG